MKLTHGGTGYRIAAHLAIGPCTRDDILDSVGDTERVQNRLRSLCAGRIVCWTGDVLRLSRLGKQRLDEAGFDQSELARPNVRVFA